MGPDTPWEVADLLLPKVPCYLTRYLPDPRMQPSAMLAMRRRG